MADFGFESVSQALAVVAYEMVETARASAICAAIQDNSDVTAEVTGTMDPTAASVEHAAFSALGLVVKAANDTRASGRSIVIPMDAGALSQYRQLYDVLTRYLVSLNRRNP